MPAVSELPAHVMMATTARGLATRVTAGENRGETLAHGPVVRTLRALGDVGPAGFHARVRQAQSSDRIVVLVESQSLHVLGAATTL